MNREELISVSAVRALEAVTAHGAIVTVAAVAATKTEDGGEIQGYSVTIAGYGVAVQEVSTELPSLIAYASQKWLAGFEARVRELAA